LTANDLFQEVDEENLEEASLEKCEARSSANSRSELDLQAHFSEFRRMQKEVQTERLGTKEMKPEPAKKIIP
jgi:hypothetical protein